MNVSKLRAKIKEKVASYQQDEEIPMADPDEERSRFGQSLSKRIDNPEGLLERDKRKGAKVNHSRFQLQETKAE